MVQSNNVYNLMVSLGQESGHSLAGCFTSGSLTGCNQGIDCIIAILGPTGERSTFKATPIFSEFSSSRDVRWRPSVPRRKLDEGHPQFVAT